MIKSTKIRSIMSKYPYCVKSDDSKHYFSEKVCRYTIRIRKKIVRKTKRLFAYGQLIFSLGTGLFPSQAMGLPISPGIMKSNTSLSKQAIIAQVMQDMPAEFDFTKREMYQLYDLSIECKNNFISEEELITKISNLRGGDLKDATAALVIIGVIILMDYNARTAVGFQPNPVAVIPRHLYWLYGNNYKPGQFGSGKGSGPRSITVVQNAGSDKKDPSSGSWNYEDVIKELKKQSRKNRIEIEIGSEMYMFKNPDPNYADILEDSLAETIYDSIRECDTDICDIAENIGCKADNIKKIKDHVFYNKHDLDRYGPIEHKRFDPSLEQALAWKRLEAGTHLENDITWLKHEYAERHHELKYNSGYNEAHERAQRLYNGYPWENNF